MARYRKIDVRIHSDAKVQRLSRPQPNGRSLWFELLTHKHMNIPGLIEIGETALAEQLEWPLEGLREAFRELLREGLAKADWKARLVWIPKAIVHNPPQSPNVVKSWETFWDELPECELKSEAWDALKHHAESMGNAYGSEFLKACPEPSWKPSPKPSVKPIGNHEHEHEHQHNPKADGGIPRPSGLGDTPPPSEVRQQRHSEVRSKPEPKLEVVAPEPLPPDWRPRNRQEANNAPIMQRAKWAMREVHYAAEYQPQEWPEVVLVAQAFQVAYRLAPMPLGRLDGDKHGTQRIVSLLTQYTPDQLVRVCQALPSEKISKDRIEKGERPRLGWLSDEVVRTAYAALPGERPLNDNVKRALQAARKATA